MVLAAVMRNGWLLKCAFTDVFEVDKDVVRAAVAQRGFPLQDVSAELWADKEVVFAAVAAHGRDALAYVSADLQDGGFDAYLGNLPRAYSVPVSVFMATVLSGSASPLPAARSEAVAAISTDIRTAKTTRRLAPQSSGLQQLNFWGPRAP